MRKNVFMMAAVAMCLTACEKIEIADPDGSGEQTEQTAEQVKTKKFTFTVKGDFTNEWKPVTRGYLQADGRDMTDLWVLDYSSDGTLLQQLHQSDNTAEDFGKPVLNLAYGSHHVYFIASRGTSPTLNTTDKTITWTKVYDTFYKDYEVSVVSTSNGNRAVTLDRNVTKLHVAFTDAVSMNAATFNVIPATWYYGFNYATGAPCAAASNQAAVINIPESSLGQSGQSSNLFGFSTVAEWTTNLTINSKDADGNIIGQATIENAPFKANRVTEYSGPLFGSEGTGTLTLQSNWDEQFSGTW